jgi:alkanesulfonate monooxygenase SsuD/methylene tetrahydromethanopterin reductase-like flavin-dependent oxidoreductase (luciferase family)
MSPDAKKVTFGLFMTRNYLEDDDLGRGIQDQSEQVRAVEAAGFTSLAFGHHFLTRPIRLLSPIPFASSLAGISGDMKLIMGVILLPLVHPVQLADDLATLDWVSGGRLVFGVGIGYRPAEFEAMGVSLRDRVGRFMECLDVVKAIWSEDAVWSYQGKHYNFGPTPAGLRPRQEPHPPIWVATDVDNAVKRAARLGAAWYINPRAKLESLAQQLDLYKQTLAEAGHAMPDVFPIRREAFVATTDGEARATAVRYLKRMLALYESWGQYDVMPGAERKDREFGEDDIPDTYLVGTPERVSDLIAKYHERLGVNHFVLRTQWPGMPQLAAMRSIDLLANRLVPQFA